MLITYSRPQDLDPKQLDPAAPAADLDPAGYECEAETVDVGGTPWSCTRRPDHTDDEHRAVFGQLGDGPAEAVAIAWAYEHGGAGYGPTSPEPVHTITVTVTFPESASTDALTDRIAADVLSSFWECDHDHVRVAVTSSTRPARPSGARPLAGGRARGPPLALPELEQGQQEHADGERCTDDQDGDDHNDFRVANFLRVRSLTSCPRLACSHEDYDGPREEEEGDEGNSAYHQLSVAGHGRSRPRAAGRGVSPSRTPKS